jgi:hypothetical protein
VHRFSVTFEYLCETFILDEMFIFWMVFVCLVFYDLFHVIFVILTNFWIHEMYVCIVCVRVCMCVCTVLLLTVRPTDILICDTKRLFMQSVKKIAFVNKISHWRSGTRHHNEAGLHTKTSLRLLNTPQISHLIRNTYICNAVSVVALVSFYSICYLIINFQINI